MISIRAAESDADLAAWVEVRRRVLPGERPGTVAELRALASPARLVLVAEIDGVLAGSGVCDRSDTAGRASVAPRVVPELRRRGLGTALLERLLAHAGTLGVERARALADDGGSAAFGRAHGFEEVDRQIEQVRAIGDEPEPEPEPYPGVELTTVAADPTLLERAYPLARHGFEDLVLAVGQAMVSREAWLRDEATLPEGSIVALADGEVVGYAGLLRWDDDPTRAENGLTVVARDRRRQGLALALKRRQLAWASRAGIRELVTWTQIGNEGMRRANERLGYRTGTISSTLERPL